MKHILLILVCLASSLHAEMSLTPYIEVSGKTHSNYNHSDVSTYTSYSTIDGGGFATFDLTQTFSAKATYLHSVEFAIEDMGNKQHLNILSVGLDKSWTTGLNTGINLNYQTFLDRDYSDDAILIYGLTPYVSWAVRPKTTLSFLGYANTLDFGSNLIQSNSKVALKSETELGESSELTLQVGYAQSKASEASLTHDDWFLKTRFSTALFWGLDLDTSWNLTAANYSESADRSDLTQSFELGLDKMLTESFSISSSLTYLFRNSTDETNDYDDFSAKLGVSIQPKLAWFKKAPFDKDKAFDEAKAFNAQQKYKRSIPLLEKIIKQDPDYIEAYYILSYALIKSDEMDRAKQILLRLYVKTEDPNISSIINTL